MAAAGLLNVPTPGPFVTNTDPSRLAITWTKWQSSFDIYILLPLELQMLHEKRPFYYTVGVKVFRIYSIPLQLKMPRQKLMTTNVQLMH